MSSKPIAPTLWRATATMKANSPASTLFDVTINVPDAFGKETAMSVLLLNYPYVIVDGYVSSTITPDAQLAVVVNDGQKVIYSHKLNDTLVQSGRPRIPLFRKPIYVRPGTKIQLKLRNLDAVGSSDVAVTVYLEVRHP